MDPPGQTQVTGVILAGGQSRRLGQSKALIPIGGRTLIERVLESVTLVSAEVIVVVASPEQAVALPLPPASGWRPIDIPAAAPSAAS